MRAYTVRTDPVESSGMPATLQFLVVMIASSINEGMQSRLDYKTEEVLVLKEIRSSCTPTGNPSPQILLPRGRAGRICEYLYITGSVLPMKAMSAFLGGNHVRGEEYE